jgi:signal peptidase I
MARRISAADIALIILTLLLLVVIVYRVSGNVTPLLVVKSGSMEPTLKVGDVIVIEPASPEDINIGDVIVFWNPWYGNLVVHRVVHKTDEGVYTRGDANAGTDPWSPVPYRNIVGKWTGLQDTILDRNRIPLIIPLRRDLSAIWAASSRRPDNHQSLLRLEGASSPR